MNRKPNSSAKKKTKPVKASKPPQAPSLSRTGMEQMMRHIHRAMQGKEFASLEDANDFLATLAGTGLKKAVENAPPLSPREQAQDLAYAAIEAGTQAEARELARLALFKDPDCVDALVLMTELDARTPREAIWGLRKAVEAGERSLGAEFFAENKGHFWGILETRPYMRARQQLADVLNTSGMEEDAIRHYEALLELNPNDNQGVRDSLLGCYLAADNLEGARHLLKQYEQDISAVFAWGRTLERFLSGDRQGAVAALKIAREENRFVELYLSGEKEIPDTMPPSYSLGSREEALVCVEVHAAAWARHKQAVFWLLDQIHGMGPREQPVE